MFPVVIPLDTVAGGVTPSRTYPQHRGRASTNQARTQITCLSLDVEQKSAPMAITRYGGQCSRQPVFHPIP